MPNFQNLMGAQQVVIPASGSFSGSAYLNGEALIGVAIPGTFTTAPLSFQVTSDPTPPHNGGTWLNFYSGTTEYNIGTLYGTAMLYLPSPSDMPSIHWLRLRTGLSTGGTVQSAAGTFVLITRPV